MSDRLPYPLIIVIGETGAGKSYFCNKLCGQKIFKDCDQKISATSIT